MDNVEETMLSSVNSMQRNFTKFQFTSGGKFAAFDAEGVAGLPGYSPRLLAFEGYELEESGVS